MIADVIGIAYPPSALFVIAFGFILLLLLHFSIAVSKLTDQSKVLAQRVALLEQRQRELEARPTEAREAGAGGESGGVEEADASMSREPIFRSGRR